MRHLVSGRKLGRSKDQRKLLFRNLMGELILRGRVKTTRAKAKTIIPLIDKLVSKAKRMDLSEKREVLATLPKDAAAILLESIAPHFKDRTSGFSKIIHLKERSGDNAQLVILEWMEQIEIKSAKIKAKNKQSLRSSELEKEVKGQAKELETTKKVARKRRASKKA